VIAFFDASALIYLIEARSPFADAVQRTLRDLAAQHPGLHTAVSRLSWLACRVGPLRGHDLATLSRYDGFFARPDLIWVDITQDVVELATLLRARHGLRTPDALHAASCLQLGHDHAFLTGDAAFSRVSGLNVRSVA